MINGQTINCAAVDGAAIRGITASGTASMSVLSNLAAHMQAKPGAAASLTLGGSMHGIVRTSGGAATAFFLSVTASPAKQARPSSSAPLNITAEMAATKRASPGAQADIVMDASLAGTAQMTPVGESDVQISASLSAVNWMHPSGTADIDFSVNGDLFVGKRASSSTQITMSTTGTPTSILSPLGSSGLAITGVMPPFVGRAVFASSDTAITLTTFAARHGVPVFPASFQPAAEVRRFLIDDDGRAFHAPPSTSFHVPPDDRRFEVGKSTREE